MQGPLIKIDVKSLKSINKDGISPKIEVDFIKAWENENQQIIKGDIVVFNSGWDKYLKESSLYHKYAVGPIIAKDEPGWPVPSIETLDYLFAKGVICYAIDTPSMGASDGGEILHRHALAKSLIFVEGLANLDSVPIVGYHFMFLPLKLDKATGSCPQRERKNSRLFIIYRDLFYRKCPFLGHFLINTKSNYLTIANIIAYDVL
jgi:kynurenine formamidase